MLQVARYVGPDGKERAKHFARKRDAQDWVDGEVTTKIGTHTWVDPSRSRELFRQMAEAWFATKATKKAKTVAGYRSILDTLVLPRWGELQLSEITYEDVQTWIATCRWTAASGSRTRAYRRRGWYRLSLEMGSTPSAPSVLR